jgi:hypothetical protein
MRLVTPDTMSPAVRRENIKLGQVGEAIIAVAKAGCENRGALWVGTDRRGASYSYDLVNSVLRKFPLGKTG